MQETCFGFEIYFISCSTCSKCSVRRYDTPSATPRYALLGRRPPLYSAGALPSPAGLVGSSVPVALVPLAAAPPLPPLLVFASASFSVLIFSTIFSISSAGSISISFPGAITAISMFLAPVCTTSRRDLMASSMVSGRERSAEWLRSRNSRTVFEERPMALAFLFVCQYELRGF
jgi:hypothetical protein